MRRFLRMWRIIFRACNPLYPICGPERRPYLTWRQAWREAEYHD